MGITPTTRHGLSKQAKKDADWHTSLNSTLDKIDVRLPSGYAGNPNTHVPGEYLGQPVYDYTNKVTYHCTTIGAAGVAVWEPESTALDKEVKMWWGTIAEIPSGYQLCDGTNGVPDLRNKFIIGANADDGGVAKSTITGSALQAGGSANVNTGAGGAFTISGTVGNTTLTTSQIPAHSHGVSGITATGGAHDHMCFSSVEDATVRTVTNSNHAKRGFTGGTSDERYKLQADLGNASVGRSSSANIGTLTFSGSTDDAGSGQSHTHTFTGDDVSAHQHSVVVIPPFYALAFITRTPIV